MSATTSPESTALTIAPPPGELTQVTNAASLILGPSFDRIQSFAGLMAKGAVSVPKHLRGNMGDCMAITIQALGWGMNPFAVAQKTHLSQSGALGYEAQLVSAILVSTRAVRAEPEYTPVGDWEKVLGKVEERQGKARDDGSPGGKYYVATYTKQDEQGVGVTVRATLAGETKPRELTVMMSQAYPRFSTQWATDPYQQLCYLAVRKWARLHSPGSVLGVYTPDELEGGTPPEKFMGPAEVVGATPPPPPAPPVWPDDKFAAQLPRWTKAVQEGLKTTAEIINLAKTKGDLTPAQEAQINAIKAPATTAPDTGEITMTFAAVADKLGKASDMDKLAEAGSLISMVPDEGQRKELGALYDRRAAELNT